MAKNVCAICGKELGAFSSSCNLIDSDTVGVPDELREELSRSIMCLPCYNLQNRVRRLDPEATESWKQYLGKQQNTSVRSYMEAVVSAVTSSEEGQQREQERKANRERQAAIDSIEVTSGFNFEGHTITNYLGFISEETAVGMGFFKGFASSVSNLTGTESDSLRKKLMQSKQIVMNRLREDAYDVGANAIIGIDLDYTMFGDSIVGVIVSGTAVSIVPNGA